MDSDKAQPFVDVRQVRRNFTRAAANYDAVAVLAREIDRRMLERLDYVKIAPTSLLDLGCGTGASLTALSERYPKALALGLDASLDMLRAGRGARSRLRWKLPFLRSHKTALCAADAQNLPIKSASVGLVWSNLMLHWLDTPLPALREMHRMLEVGGLLMFSTFGPDTLKELRASSTDGYARTQRFTDLHDYGDMLVECGFADPVMDVEHVTLTYAKVSDLFHDLRHNGAGCAMRDRRRSLMGKNAWHALQQAYEKFRHDARLPATFEVVYGHAWKPEPSKTAEGASIVRFDPKQRGRASA